MFTWMIIISVLLILLTIGLFCTDGDEVGLISIGVVHVVTSIGATVLYCCYSSRSSYICGIVFTVVAGLLLITNTYCKGIGLAGISVLYCGCMAAGYLNVYAYLEFAISCSVLFVAAVAGIVTSSFANYGEFPSWWCWVLDIAATLIVAAGLIVGYCMYAKIKKGASVAVGCYVYKYDDVLLTTGREEQSKLYFNEYYALRVDFDWNNLTAYTTESEKMRIQVTFPEAVDYVSSGMKFEASSDNKIWTYDFELNAKSVDEMKSGYFVFNYSYDQINAAITSVNVHIGLTPSDTDSEGSKKTSKIFAEYDKNYELIFIKKNYPFTDADIIKDLSQADNGSYRITPPDGCEQLQIKIYNHDKTGVYYSGKVDCGADDYRLSILRMLESNVIESVYNQIVENKESLIVEITAIGNSVYDDTSMSFTYNMD